MTWTWDLRGLNTFNALWDRKGSGMLKLSFHYPAKRMTLIWLASDSLGGDTERSSEYIWMVAGCLGLR
jgi:hypothetical protein